jgi:hypothetical protein
MNRLAILLVLFTVACSDPHSLTVTEANRDDVTKKVAQSSRFTAREKELFVAYQARTLMGGALSRAFGVKDQSTTSTGRTVGDLIKEEETWEQQRIAEEADNARLAKEARAKGDATLAALRRSVRLIAYDLKPRPSTFIDATDVMVVYQNISGKDIRAFEGRLIVKDVLGAELDDSHVKDTQILKAGQKRDAAIFTTSLVSAGLRGKKFEDVKTEWRPTTVLFVDGSKLTLEPEAP